MPLKRPSQIVSNQEHVRTGTQLLKIVRARLSYLLIKKARTFHQFDLVNGQVTVDRSQAGEQYAQEFGTTRSCPIDNQATTATIFIDNSVFEIFINKGEKVFSGRVFPHADQNGILIKSGNPTGTYYELDYGRKTN